MKKLIIQSNGIVDLQQDIPILVYKDGGLMGMIIKSLERGWQAITVDDYIDYFFAYHSRDKLCEDLIKEGYELKVDL